MWFRPSWVVVGVPVPGAENPFVASVSQLEAGVEVEVSEGGGGGCASVEGFPGRVGVLLRGFVERLVEGLGGGLCVRARLVGGAAGAPLGGLYAGASVSVVYEVARWHGETLDVDEALEAARLADPGGWGVEWSVALDALRYAVLEGGVVVYRSEEERAILPADPLPVEVRGSLAVGEPLSRDAVGPEVYNGIVHTAGAAALAAAVMVRDGVPLAEAAGRLSRVLWGVAHAVWGVEPVEGCLPSPGLPGFIEVACPKGSV